MDSDFVLKESVYEWTVRAFSQVKKVLGLNIKLHGNPLHLHEGDIFVFNHFARIETFLPHYLIYQETGAFCRSIATSDLFKGSETFANFLKSVGVISNDYEGLLPMLVAEIIRGRKVIIFPEGGMVKDRKIVDHEGKLRIYSQEGKESRKHHSGAALLALALNTVKQAILCAEKDNNWEKIDKWLEILDLDDRDQLLQSANKPTTIIPTNITFYPINTEENFLSEKIKSLSENLSEQMQEELIIESNLLLKNTDMDMRLGNPIYISQALSWWEKKIQLYLSRDLTSINHFFTLNNIKIPWNRVIQSSIKHSSGKVRDLYMEAIYKETTVNLYHIASTTLLQLFEQKHYSLTKKQYYLCVYLAIKALQINNAVNLHRGLQTPLFYAGLAEGDDKILEKFINAGIESELLTIEDDRVHIQQKITHDVERSSARIQNTIQVYANEVAPILRGNTVIKSAIDEINSLSDIKLSYHRHDDELRSHACSHQFYNTPVYDDINLKETATESGRPFLMISAAKKTKCKIGIVLVHGFLASPAEIKPIAEKLHNAGYPVYGARLAGHGTSPADLREQPWENWVKSVATACDILSPYAEKIVLLGFSTGSIVSLLYASQKPDKFAAVIAINSPLKFKDKKMLLVPLIHNVSSVVNAISPLEDAISYRANDSEHPQINYKSIPIKGLNEILKINERLSSNFDKIVVPCLLMQSSQDPIISEDCISILEHGLINAETTSVIIDSKRHGILYESVGDTHKVIIDYVDKLSSSSALATENIE